ncbi:serine hydrolase domain-containing protein [Actinoplanes teichomyceticus]|uniref:CubicO group peptidase (Beta-lactamase class C family) n=1 Tax=Actinoplanes teichomyceticus TaxID=1867 RepID=A0A561VII3_ACTTI|nr:serine hydrolase domain-containing protein [Actinoplanes teichomyceticus]TWG11394.1 CubicO group peptidase (beta-lactamase class C family) [Actinoplanes teichomyceticus]GIF15794.1 serine hydrolase [Actinoplanes teichomyceticus]
MTGSRLLPRFGLAAILSVASPSVASAVGTAVGTAVAAPVRAPAGTPAQAPAVTPADIRFRRDVLRPGDARRAGLLPGPIARLPGTAAAYLRPTPEHPGHPAYAGATVLAAHHGIVVARFAVGDAVRYTARPGGIAELPPRRRIPARADTLWDLASVSKLFTTIVVLQQAEAGRVSLDAPVAAYVPEFAAGGKAGVTLRHLLTHTSGLPAYRPLHRCCRTPARRLAAALATPVGARPGDRYVYSDIGLIALGALIERVTGGPLADAVRAGITGPLRMHDTGYRPDPARRDRIAATEYQPAAGRGLVWGEVHDENAWALGGAAGHAGVFSTADDLAVLCQALLDGGTYRGRRILSEPMVRQALTDHHAGLLPRGPGSARGLGFELANHAYMDAMASPVTFGHTGFTGTSIVIDPLDQSFLIVLGNRVHPDRGWGGAGVARRALARTFASAHPVHLPPGGAWRTGRRDGATMTLTAPLRRAADGRARAAFLLRYDTEPGRDTAHVESSADGVTWTALPMRLRHGRRSWRSDGPVTGFGGRCWWRVTAALPAGATRLRFTYRTDGAAQGRGVLVARLRVAGPGGVPTGGAARHTADGWTLVGGGRPVPITSRPG